MADILLALPAGLPIGVEAPMCSRAEQGLSVQECARLAVAGARAVLATVSAARSAS